ncbi:oligosaccharide flippase family protein [Porticoccaceae bacterium]|nr:oligosaccharide flippase family protein [Porticoccaceae bacterium]
MNRYNSRKEVHYLSSNLIPSLKSIKARAINGSIWSALGFGSAQFVRLLSNLLLTRLLFPEVFGVMALVMVVLQGIKMFSDIGISTSVVRDERGDNPDYLNTAWTLQTMRGVAIWAISCALAYPASNLYEAPQLLALIPVIGFTAVIQGFNAPGILSLKRHMKVRQLISWEFTTQLVTVVMTVLLAWQYRSIWAIAVGGVLGALIGCFLSYIMTQSKRPRFLLEPDALNSIFRFGKWIFLSTALTFVVRQGDVLLLGVFLTKTQLGLFSIAVIWSRVLLQLLLKINHQVMMPLYAEAYRNNKYTIKDNIKKTRMYLLLASLPFVCVMVLGGQFFIELLYDVRYHSAGWMLQMLSIGTIGMVINATAGTALLSFGDSFGFMLVQVARAFLLVICMLVGGIYFGVVGMITGVVVSNLFSYPVLAMVLHRHRVWQPSVDLIAFCACACVIGFGLIATDGMNL